MMKMKVTVVMVLCLVAASHAYILRYPRVMYPTVLYRRNLTPVRPSHVQATPGLNSLDLIDQGTYGPGGSDFSAGLGPVSVPNTAGVVSWV